MPDRFLKLRHVMAMTALSRSSIYAYVAAGTFPGPIHIGLRSVAWSEKAISEWIDERIGAH
jgi:prophage regulatory protein